MGKHKPTVDPLTLSLIENRLDSLNQELGSRVVRQSLNPVICQIRDFGTVLFDKEERVITVGNYMPLHTAGGHIALKGMLDYIGRENIHPDDFIISNHPFIVRFGHPPDWSFIRPIFYEGELVFYHYFRGHQFDSGGAFSVGYFPRVFDCHAEGLMIPPIKIIENGKIDEKCYSLILSCLRGANIVRSDNMLIYSSMKMVEKRLLSILKDYGKDAVLAGCGEKIKRTEEAVKKTISQWPGGEYRAERAADWDGTTDKPVWVRLTLTVKPEDGQLVFDFSDSDPQVEFINSPKGQTYASVVVALAWSLPSGIPRDQGLMNCISVITKKGSVLDPVYPATSSCQAVTLGQMTTECVQLALSQVVPKDTSALWARHMSFILFGKRRDRIDPRTNSTEIYSQGTFHGMSSNGAIWGYDGDDGLGSPLAAGAARGSPIEVLEWDVPYRWLYHELVPDSAGDGQWRGGVGVRAKIVNTDNPDTWRPLDHTFQSGASEGEDFGPLGFLGGTEGNKNKTIVTSKGKKIPFRTKEMRWVEPGDTLENISGGSGGIGYPVDRDVEKVRMDVINGLISFRKAKEVYGVVIDEQTFQIDYEATNKLRAKLKNQKRRKNIS